jgi:RND family efflux transporter MFP subunit
MMHRYAFPSLAIGLLGFAVAYALYMQRPEPELPPPVPPPVSPFGDTVAGAGMVEPSTEASGTSSIAVGSQLAGAVLKVRVRIGQEVKAGDVLFELDPRQTEADLKVREANVLASEAQVGAAEATFLTQQDQWERDQKLDRYAVSDQDRLAHYEAMRNSKAQLQVARANLALARAQVEQDQTTLALLKVQAPVDGTVLQVNVRPGEYVSIFAGQPLILLGNLHPLHVRVSVDEEDLPRLKLYAPARAKIRGDPRQEEVLLSFVRLEPYVVPKTSLTGANTERVDTRVVQVIYAIDPQNQAVLESKILVGQLLDVFIDAAPAGTAGRAGRERPTEATP